MSNGDVGDSKAGIGLMVFMGLAFGTIALINRYVGGKGGDQGGEGDDDRSSDSNGTTSSDEEVQVKPVTVTVSTTPTVEEEKPKVAPKSRKKVVKESLEQMHEKRKVIGDVKEHINELIVTEQNLKQALEVVERNRDRVQDPDGSLRMISEKLQQTQEQRSGLEETFQGLTSEKESTESWQQIDEELRERRRQLQEDEEIRKIELLAMIQVNAHPSSTQEDKETVKKNYHEARKTREKSSRKYQELSRKKEEVQKEYSRRHERPETGSTLEHTSEVLKVKTEMDGSGGSVEVTLLHEQYKTRLQDGQELTIGLDIGRVKGGLDVPDVSVDQEDVLDDDSVKLKSPLDSSVYVEGTVLHGNVTVTDALPDGVKGIEKSTSLDVNVGKGRVQLSREGVSLQGSLVETTVELTDGVVDEDGGTQTKTELKYTYGGVEVDKGKKSVKMHGGSVSTTISKGTVTEDGFEEEQSIKVEVGTDGVKTSGSGGILGWIGEKVSGMFSGGKGGGSSEGGSSNDSSSDSGGSDYNSEYYSQFDKSEMDDVVDTERQALEDVRSHPGSTEEDIRQAEQNLSDAIKERDSH